MPPRSVPRRAEDIIFYYYAKLVIAPSAGFHGNYAFIIDTYRRLKNGEIYMSLYDRELIHLAQTSRECSFCSKHAAPTEVVEIVPKKFGGPIGIHNLIRACQDCATSKGDKDLVEWWCEHLGKPRDELPRLPIGLYLKMAYELHTVAFSLNQPCRSLGDLFKILRSKSHAVHGRIR